MRFMRFSRRATLHLGAAALGAAAAFGTCAQAFPDRPVTIVLAYPAGSVSDVLARSVAQQLSAEWKQPVVVDNRPGGNQIIATTVVAKAPADGYTLLMADDGVFTLNPHLFSKLPYSVSRDFEPVTPLVRNYFFVVVPSGSKWRTMGDLIAAAKARSGGVTYGSWGVASPAHLGGLMLESAAGIQMAHVPYKESAQLYTSVANGELDWAIGSAASAGAMQQSGKVRFLAAAAPARIAGYEKVPTSAEAGGPAQWTVGGWNGLLAPRGTPQDVVLRLNEAIAKAMQAPDIREKLSLFTYEPYTMPPAEMGRLMAQETAAWEPVIRKAGIKLD